jgi:selenocysteine lyase/cysteine desulfurase
LAGGLGGLALSSVASGRGLQPDDERAWAEVAAAWDSTPGHLNLESGGVQAPPRVVDEAFRLAWDAARRLPPVHLLREQFPRLEEVRSAVAAAAGFPPEEIALVRNTTEALQNVLLGWPLARSERVLTSTQDYWRLQEGLDQRAERDGIGIDRIRIPVPLPPDGEVVARWLEAVRPETRLALVSEVVNLTGQVLPVAALTAALHARGVAVVVDGAHGFAHLDGSPASLEADAYGTSLHKWLGAPFGTGFLRLRRDRVASVWPLFPSAARKRDDIRKFESLGTIAAAPFLGILPALDWWRQVGPSAKLARLRFLRDHWLAAFAGYSRGRLLTRVDGNAAGAIATLSLPGRDPRLVAEELRRREGILIRAIVHPEFSGLRVTPNLHNSIADLERLVAALRRCLRD